MPPLKHELLIEIVSNPLFKEELLTSFDWTDVSSDDILSFRNVLQFNEQEILIRPFAYTKRYISNKDLEIISNFYFSKYGLHRKRYTEKVKTYGLILFKYLCQARKPCWLQDIAKYEFILFSQLWITSSNHDNVFNSQASSRRYLVSNLCKLKKFSFDIEAYMKNSEDLELLLGQKTDTYLIFIGHSKTPSVSIKSIDKVTYSFIKFCTQARSLSEISGFFKAKLSFNEKESTDISLKIIDSLTTWNILNISYS